MQRGTNLIDNAEKSMMQDTVDRVHEQVEGHTILLDSRLLKSSHPRMSRMISSGRHISRDISCIGRYSRSIGYSFEATGRMDAKLSEQ